MFNSLLLKMLKSKHIAKEFDLNKEEVENSLNLIEFKEAIWKVKFKNNMVCFVLLFYRKFIEKKDEIIIN